MPFTILVLATRKPTLSPDEFKHHYETKHLPLLRSLVGLDLMPPHSTRQYFARIDRQGFGGPANRNRPLLMLRGTSEDVEYDVLTQMTWDTEQQFQKFYKAIYETTAAARLAEDEEHFLDPGKLRAIVVGDTVDCFAG